MINVLMPLSGGSNFVDSEEYFYPQMRIEIQGKPMVQHAIENLQTIHKELQFVFIVKKSDCAKFHLDDTLRLLANDSCKIIMLDHETKGAACSALMAVDEINNNDPLIISNFDQIIDANLSKLYSEFKSSEADAGCLVFNTKTAPRIIKHKAILASYAALDNCICQGDKHNIVLARSASCSFFLYVTNREVTKKYVRNTLKVPAKTEVSAGEE